MNSNVSPSILIVEDEFVTARDIQRQLSRLDYQITGIVDSGEAAVEKVAEIQPDLVLMDIVLQGAMNGIAAAEQIRQRYQVPIVYLTAFADRDTLEQAKLTQPFGYILKPFKAEDLNITIQIALNRHRVEQAIRQQLAQPETPTSTYLAAASNEMRKPLTVIKAAVELLDQFGNQCTQSKRQDYIRMAQEAVESMTQMLDNIITIGQIETGQMQPRLEIMDIGPFCRDLAAALQITQDNQVAISVNQQDMNLPTYLDAKLLWQILANLLTNAVRFSRPKQTVRVDLSLYRGTNPLAQNAASPCCFTGASHSYDRWLLIQICDQGRGIPPEDLPYVLQPFYRGRNVGNVTGSGLGLAIVKACVEVHGGMLEIRSQLGIGSSCTIALPCDPPTTP